MILDGTLAAARDKYQVCHTSGHRLFDGVLNQWLVNDRQHLLGHGFGGWQETGAKTGHREYSFSDGAHKLFPQLFWMIAIITV